MGGIPRIIKPHSFQTPRLGAAADFNVPRAARPESNLDFAADRAQATHSGLNRDGSAHHDAPKIEKAIQGNLEGLYHKAKTEGIDPADYSDEWGDFIPPEELNYMDSFMMNPYGPSKKQGIAAPLNIASRGHAAIGKTNGEEVLRGLYGDEMAGNIAQRFLGQNGKGHNGLLNIDRDGPGAHLFEPAYMIRSENTPKEAYAYYAPSQRYALLPNTVKDEFVIPHELTHLNLEGRQAGPRNHGLPTWDDIASSLQKNDQGQPTINGDPHHPLLYFLQRWGHPESGRAELVADWAMANRGRSAIMGNPSRSDDAILGNLHSAVSGNYIRNPTLQLGPQAGSQLWWQPAVEAAQGIYWNMRKKDSTPLLNRGLRDSLMKMSLDSGSTQDGHPKYPNA